MLTLLIGTDWVVNRDEIFNRIADDVSRKMPGRILIVPELISHDTERRLCEAAGDTASRFAEVLSFTRLYRRVSEVAGQAALQCLDQGGRLVAMASAARQLHSKLKAYASVETRPEFLTALIDAVDEFKRCCVGAEDLVSAAAKTGGVLAQKLEELSLLLDTYDGVCRQGKRDPSDQMTWLLEELETTDYAKEHVFYIDGFPDFTRQHLAILEHLITYSTSVVVSLNCDSIGSSKPAFEKAGETALFLYRFAKQNAIAVEIVYTTPRNDHLLPVREKLFAGEITYRAELNQYLQLYRAQSVQEECLAAAEQIMQLARAGARYRDISVVCGDITAYQNTVDMIFRRCNIPVYRSGTEDILEKPVIITVLSAIEAALGGFERRDVLRYLKSMLSPLSLKESDAIENYAVLWNISGSRWTEQWHNHPAGLGHNFTENDEQALLALNNARQLAIEPLFTLRQNFRDAKNVEEQVKSLYGFLEQICLWEHLSQLAAQMEDAGDHRNCQILSQLWDILLDALEQLNDILGKTYWDSESFTRLFKLLLSQYDVGTIPPVLDAVMVGPVSAMRCQSPRHLIILGALEGCLPGYSGSVGILTDHERTTLRQLGVPLSGGGIEGVQAEFSEIYGVFCGASESIRIYCPPGQPSFLYRRLCAFVEQEQKASVKFGAAGADRLEAGAFLSRWDLNEYADSIGLSDTYALVEACKKYRIGSIDKETVQKLYGKKLRLSASQIDKKANCSLAYFLRYGLGAEEWKEATVDPAEFGTYVHAVLENTVKEVMEKGGFAVVSLEDTLKIAADHSEAYAKERFSQIDSQRIQYIFNRNKQELNMIVQELWQEMQLCAFVPVAYELSFGDGGDLQAIQIPGKTMEAQLRGFVDRVDVWQENGQSYFRVVDYKTGKKDFDYCDLYNGYGLQMLLYLFALEDGGAPRLGQHPVPAGVQYFPARAPLIASDGALSDEEAATVREKAWKRKGLLLADEAVLNAMEQTEKPIRSCFTRKKDGTLGGDIADREQFQLLKSYIFMLLGKFVDAIASGCVDADPYTRGSAHNACTYCPYGSICHKTEVEGRRNYKTITASRFWEDIKKEVDRNG